MKNKKLEKVIDVFLTIFIWVFFTVVALICVRVFMFETYRIPSHSMTPTIISGDKVLANKFIFGARIYKNLDFLEGGRLETWRVPGLRGIRHNDMVAFNYPYEHGRGISFDISIVHLKRCVGIPGDTLSISNGFIYASSFSGDLGYHDNLLELSQADSTKYAPGIFRALARGTASANNWTIRNLGPLYIPEKEGTVTLDSMNYRLYQAIIEYETGGKLSFEGGRLTLDDNDVNRYTFMQNYYFMVGDNAINSRDSRYWGFVPEEYIVGVVDRVLWSYDRETKKINWKRVFKNLK